MKRKKVIVLVCVLGIVAVIAALAVYVNGNRQRADGINEQLKMVYSDFLRGEYDAAANDESINGKAMVYIASESDMESSAYYTLIGKDYYGIDGGLFTADPEECTEVIIVYPEQTNAGTYHSGGMGASTGSAYKTTTCAVVIHMESGTASFVKRIASSDPPKAKASGGDGRGAFEAKKALDYIAGLLQ